jgi:hypothetical protein
MPRLQSPEGEVPLAFPKAGIDRSLGFWRQGPVEMPNGQWGATTPMGVNVRAFEGELNRSRGGSRHGWTKYLSGRMVASWVVQELNQITIHGTPSGSMQTSSSGRIVYLVGVSQGDVYYVSAGGTSWTEATNNTGNTPPLNFTGIVRSAVNNLKLYFADGVNWVYFDPDTLAVETWTASAGTLPVDASSNKPRGITTWRGRTVLWGLIEDPHNWFMSAQSEPRDFDYSPSSTTQTQAVAGNNSPLGLIGDVITGVCPYNDDILLFFGDHSIYAMTGDPMAGGSLSLVSDAIGAAWGQAWAKDPYGAVYFYSNLCGVYRMTPSQAPQRISQQIEQLLDEVNTGTNTIRLLWNDRFQGLHVFITPTANAAAGTNAFHFFWEQRTGAWWKDTFGHRNLNPLCCLSYDGNLPDDRAAIIGSWDGYVRSVSEDATDDDGYDISSEVILGPLLTAELDEVLFKDIQAVLGETSGSVSFAVHTGRTAEIALDNDAVASGTWTAGRNLTLPIRRSAHALWVKITSTNTWAIEAIRARIAGQGKVRKRGY